MKRVLKWPIPLDDQWHSIPSLRGGWHVAWQHGAVTLWAEDSPHDPNRSVLEETTRVRVFGTGHRYANTCRYLGTAFDPRGFVWHVVEAERSQ